MRGSLKRKLDKTGREKPNVWEYRIDLGQDVTGRRRQKTFTLKGPKPLIEKEVARILANVESIPLSRSSTSVRDFLEQWERDYVSHLAPSTARGYKSIIHGGLIPALGNIKLDKFSKAHAQNYYQSKYVTTSLATVKHHHTCLSRAMETAIDWELIPVNPVASVKLSRLFGKGKRPEMDFWTQDEAQSFLGYVKDSKYYPLFYTALYTGMRRSELMGLHWRDIDNGNASIVRTLHQVNGDLVYGDPKSDNSRRTIPLTQSNIKVLRDYRLQQEAEAALMGVSIDDMRVFPFRPDTITRAWKTLAVRSGVKPIHFHEARHTHATLLLKAKVHVKVVSERLGHSSIQVTLDLYSHVMEGMQGDAVEAFDELVSVL